MNNVDRVRQLSSSQQLGAAAKHDEFTSTPVPVAEVLRYATDCMVSVGVKKDHATALAEVLVAADHRGHYSHGLNRLGNKISYYNFSFITFVLFYLLSEMYVQDIQSGICDGNAVPTVEKTKFSTALVNGQNSLGPVVGNFCMKLAIEKAKQHGVGWITANSMLMTYKLSGWLCLSSCYI